MLESLFSKIAGLKACNVIKKKLQQCEILKGTYSEEHLQTTGSVYLKSKLQIYSLAEKYIVFFLASSALQTLFPPKLYLFLRLSCFLNIYNVSYSNSLNRLNALSPYQRFVPMGNA